MRELFETMEEAFVEGEFDYGDDRKTLEENLDKAKMIFAEELTNSSGFAEKLEDGEVFDIYAALYSLQRMILADRCIDRFQSDLASI